MELWRALIERSFPSATVQPAEAIYEGQRRSFLMARTRTDSTDAVVDLAQRLCVAALLSISLMRNLTRMGPKSDAQIAPKRGSLSRICRGNVRPIKELPKGGEHALHGE